MAQETNDELQRQILEADLRMKLLELDEKTENYNARIERKKQLIRGREQLEAKRLADLSKAQALQAFCNHRQGATPANFYEGTGPSCLTRSGIFFSGNYLIQCSWCGLAMQRPHPAMKSRKLREGETQQQMLARVKQYDADLALYNKLLAQSRGNGLPPMEGPKFEFTNEDGVPFIPEPR